MGKGSTPKRKLLNKKQRIESGKIWIHKYEGKHIVKGYAKWFGVNLISAILELREIGVEISQEYERDVRCSIADRMKKQKERQKRRTEWLIKLESDWDNEFEFVAGYTSNGFPFGIENYDE